MKPCWVLTGPQIVLCTYHCYAPPSQVGGGWGSWRMFVTSHMPFWEGYLPYMGICYCTFIHLCGTDLMKEIPLLIPYYTAPPLTNLGEWDKTDSCIRAHNALVSRAKLVWSGDETKQTSKQHTNACAQCSGASVGLTLACPKHQNNLKSCLSPLIPHMVILCKLTMWLKLKWTVSNKPYYCKQ